MKQLFVSALVTMLFAASFASTFAGEKPKILGKIERLEPNFDKLVPKNAELEILASGFKWTEGPVWIKGGSPLTPNPSPPQGRGEKVDGGYLLFSDIPNNAIHKWKKGEGLARDFIKPAGYTGDKPRGGEPGSNGLMLDSKGRLTL
ncbi:MAG: hypothetical protein L0Y70_11260, partial [Gemmataceae bacterium]|nr:hypothetical protein [Gemmataceae bacterium]